MNTTIQEHYANIARDVLGAKAADQNLFGGHEWPAVAAVRRACEAGHMHAALGVILSEAREFARECSDLDRQSEIFDLAFKLHGAQAALSTRSTDAYLAQGMAIWHAEDRYAGTAAAALEAAMWWAIDLEGHDKSVCAHHIEKAARELVVCSHQRALDLDEDVTKVAWPLFSPEYMTAGARHATAAADRLCVRLAALQERAN